MLLDAWFILETKFEGVCNDMKLAQHYLMHSHHADQMMK